MPRENRTFTPFLPPVDPPRGGRGTARPDFVGAYEGASIDKSPPGPSLVCRLDVTEQNGVYTLVGSMSDPNREEGMDHTSHTHWQ